MVLLQEMEHWKQETSLLMSTIPMSRDWKPRKPVNLSVIILSIRQKSREYQLYGYNNELITFIDYYIYHRLTRLLQKNPMLLLSVYPHQQDCQMHTQMQQLMMSEMNFGQQLKRLYFRIYL